VRYKCLLLVMYSPDTPYLREQGCENPWCVFEAKRGREHETLRNAALKLGCQCADDHKSYACSTTFVKDCYTEFDENPSDCCVAGTRSDTRRLTGFHSFVSAP